MKYRFSNCKAEKKANEILKKLRDYTVIAVAVFVDLEETEIETQRELTEEELKQICGYLNADSYKIVKVEEGTGVM
jgi:hypothetical protein